MATMHQDRPLTAPPLDAATQPFFAAAAQGRLMIRRCTACGKPHWYPRPVCPYCMGDTVWENSTGLGHIYSVTVTRRAGPTAFAMAYVTLDEGVTMLTNIVDCDLDALHIGQRVQVCFKLAGESGDTVSIPMFTPPA
jgi:uncharacterized OB-fold protein